jgi:hypothetical protein
LSEATLRGGMSPPHRLNRKFALFIWQINLVLSMRC